MRLVLCDSFAYVLMMRAALQGLLQRRLPGELQRGKKFL